MRLTSAPRTIGDAFEAAHIGASGLAFLVDGQMRPLLFPARLTTAQRADAPRWLRESWSLSAREAGLIKFWDGDGTREIASYTPVSSCRAGVVTVEPEAEAFWIAQVMRRQLLLAVGLCAGVALLVAIWLSDRISRPLRHLSEAAALIGAGSFPDTPTIRTGDELQTLSEAFQRMVAELKRYSDLQLERLIEAQRRIDAMLYSIEDGILMADNSGVFVLANRSASEMTGLLRGEAVEGLRPEDLPLPPEAREAVIRALSDPTGPSQEVALPIGGQPCTVRISARPVILPKSQDKRGVVLALRNVTLERELEKMKDDFLNSITHDLRTPISSIIGFSKYLLKGTGGGLTADQTEMVATISDASNRVLSLVNDILDLARMESKKLKLEPRPVALQEVAERTVRTLRGVAQQRGVILAVAPDALPLVEADPQLVERLLANLVGNAVKFARENGRVVVSGRELDGKVEVCVADDGEGIPEAYREKIFAKFEQVPGTRGGTGLGLTICRQIVQMHGGRIWVESETGRGARFFFTLPKSAVPERPAAVG